MSNNKNIALEIKNLSYSYKSNWSWRKRLTLKPFSLNIFAGESFGFLGHNGAGKTTTIKCILALIKSNYGSEVKIFGEDFKNPEARKLIGYLPEQPYFYDNLTVLELMKMYAILSGLTGSEVKSAINIALEKVRIDFKRNAIMRNLSKGQIQRVAMAQAIVAKPKLLILDEPFSGLDPLGRKEFADLIFDLKNNGATVLMSSHILSDVETICDRASIMVNGDLKGVFELDHLFDLAGSNYEIVVLKADFNIEHLKKLALTCTERTNVWRLKFDSKAIADQAFEICKQSNLEIVSYQSLRGNLEDLFIKLVQENQRNVT